MRGYALSNWLILMWAHSKQTEFIATLFYRCIRCAFIDGP